MASIAIAAMLDELMGRDRNLAPTEKRSEPKWDDPDVCKYYLVDFCPHELFTNTRADLGLCEKLHDDHLRKEYQESFKEYKKSSRSGRLGYEEDFQRYLQTLINDVEKRIRRGHQRLALNSMTQSTNTNPQSQKDEKIQMLTQRINELVQQAEELGCEGKVEEAQGIMKLCDQLNEERSDLQNQTATQDPYSEPLKAMEVCNVCGALLVVGDAQQRVDEHIMGKQHSGYARIRAYVEGKRMKSKEEEEQRDSRLKAERELREKEREKEREERKKKEEEKKKELEAEREARRVKEKEREKEREKRKKSRSRSRGRSSRDDKDRFPCTGKKRSRSRSRGHRRHGDRGGSRDRHHKSSRRHRSRSQDGKHKSKSKDPSSKKSSKEPSESRGRSEDKKSGVEGRQQSEESSRQKETAEQTEPNGEKSKPVDDTVDKVKTAAGSEEEPQTKDSDAKEAGDNDGAMATGDSN